MNLLSVIDREHDSEGTQGEQVGVYVEGRQYDA